MASFTVISREIKKTMMWYLLLLFFIYDVVDSTGAYSLIIKFNDISRSKDVLDTSNLSAFQACSYSQSSDLLLTSLATVLVKFEEKLY